MASPVRAAIRKVFTGVSPYVRQDVTRQGTPCQRYYVRAYVVRDSDLSVRKKDNNDMMQQPMTKKYNNLDDEGGENATITKVQKLPKHTVGRMRLPLTYIQH